MSGVEENGTPVPDDAPDAAPAARPALRVVRGEPDPEQLAALLAVVAASGGGAAAPTPPARGRWADPAAFTRSERRPGPGAWRAAGR